MDLHLEYLFTQPLLRALLQLTLKIAQSELELEIETMVLLEFSLKEQ